MLYTCASVKRTQHFGLKNAWGPKWDADCSTSWDTKVRMPKPTHGISWVFGKRLFGNERNQSSRIKQVFLYLQKSSTSTSQHHKAARSWQPACNKYMLRATGKIMCCQGTQLPCLEKGSVAYQKPHMLPIMDDA